MSLFPHPSANTNNPYSYKATYENLLETATALAGRADRKEVKAFDTPEAQQFASDFCAFSAALTQRVRWKDADKKATAETKLKIIGGDKEHLRFIRSLAMSVEIRGITKPLVAALRAAQGIDNYPYNPPIVLDPQEHYPDTSPSVYNIIHSRRSSGSLKKEVIGMLMDAPEEWHKDSIIRELNEADGIMRRLAVVDQIASGQVTPAAENHFKSWRSYVGYFFENAVENRAKLAAWNAEGKATPDFDRVLALADRWLKKDMPAEPVFAGARPPTAGQEARPV